MKEEKDVFPCPPEFENCIKSMATASIALHVDGWNQMPEWTIRDLQLAGRRYCHLFRERMAALAGEHDRLIPIMIAGRFEETKDDYVSESPKKRYEWWISGCFIRVVTPERKVAAARGHRLPDLRQQDVLQEMLNIGELVKQGDYCSNLVCREFTPNDDKVVTFNNQLDWTIKTIQEMLAINFTPLALLQNSCYDAVLAMRWPTSSDENTSRNWLIRKIAQLYTGRENPDASPRLVYMDSYIPPDSNKPIGETVCIYGGDDFLDIGREAAIENGAALCAPESAFA